MLYKAKDLSGYQLGAEDGEIGKIKEFYFDDKYWTIRYLVADAGNWLFGRKVLISPYAITEVNISEKLIHTRLTKQQIKDSPSWDEDKPVSRQFEMNYYGYYGWPGYWYGPYAWGTYDYPYRGTRERPESASEENRGDPNLRSSSEVTGYYIQAEDGTIGHVDDFILDDEAWRIRYLVVDTQNWWTGKEVLVSPQWIKSISWNEHQVFVNLNKETIKQAPEYNKEKPITRDYEDRLHHYYKQEGYWASESRPEKQTTFEKIR